MHNFRPEIVAVIERIEIICNLGTLDLAIPGSLWQIFVSEHL